MTINNDPPSMSKIHYDGTYNFGHVMQVLVMAVGALSLYVAQSNYNAVTELRLQESELARQKWIPIVEELARQQGATALRFDNVGKALLEVRELNGRLLDNMNAQSNRLTKVETILEIGKPPAETPQ